MMMTMPEFDGRQFNILTINTPVRDDYQLSKEARNRVTHVNVYDVLDPVQASGGYTIMDKLTIFPINNIPIISGEMGPAERKFSSALNIAVDNPQGLTDGIKNFHNSHNRIEDWVYKTENINFVVTPKGCKFEYDPNSKGK